ncbi:MAG: tRNA (guanosine(46)-N7)-methyltransferase TrmB [Phycisphaerae bacterium]|nr:tRNA (guanosine(46)-N7)-methyltransferase TrmB [Phycisphaerae bacterium]
MTLVTQDVMVAPPAEGEILDARMWDTSLSSVEIEIGCGKGGFLLEQARSRPDVLFLGVEWANKYYKFAADRMARWNVTNVRIMRTDAAVLVRRQLVDTSVSVMHVYHPDPWPKKRHHKRRLFQPEFVDAVWRVLVPEGRLHVQTDHEEYFAWIVDVLRRQDGMRQIGDGPVVRSDDVPESLRTNFEIKYRREGRSIYRASWLKCGGDDQSLGREL